MTAITIKEYFARSGSEFSNKDAQVIGPVLHALSEQGGVTARDVVDAARSTNSPLNPYFEWNDAVAADLYRVRQASNMLGAIRVRYIDDGEPKEARAFQIIRKSAFDAEPRRFRTFEVLHGDSAFAAQMLQSAFDDLVTWRKKYEPYTDIWSKFGDCFQSVVNQISEFEDEFKAQSLVTDTDGALARLIAWREECAAILANWAACREQVSYIMEAIAEAEELFGKLNTRSERKCMRCLKPFPSLNIGHRICSSCAQSADMSGMSEASVT